MRDYEKIKLKNQIEQLLGSRDLLHKNIFLWGAGDFSRCIVSELLRKNKKVEAIIDNDKSKQGAFCAGVPVLSLDDVNAQYGIDEPEIIYMICSDFWKEIVKQLNAAGVSKDRIIVIKKEKDFLYEKISDAIKGEKIYKSMIKQYGKGKIFLCPYTGTGDIYLIGSFWKQYIEKYKIKNYVFVVLSKACKKVTSLFEINNVVLLDKMIYARYLIAYYLLKKSSVDMVILNDGWRELPYSCTEWLRGYKKLYFTQLFRDFVFELPSDAKPQHPALKDMDNLLQELFEKNGLTKGKTVVLAPFSNTLLDLPQDFWSDITKSLLEKGYSVCTNCGSDTELPIEGTTKIFVPLDQAPQFVNFAGYFVGVRSGFCDIISGSTAKKVILYYKKNRFYNASAYEYFNLKNMELCEDALELEFCMNKLCEIKKEILAYL